ncbi:hypothetical protein Golomagni_05153 [Golovinomyces magnicellulatus]|nr:hypothetical protein Golomagni_05153 [Golovinomyces magnicellulatus]
MTPKETPLALSLLLRAHSPESAAKIYTERVHHRPLHLAPNNNANNLQHTRRMKRIQKKQLRVKKPGRPAPLSSRQARSLDLYSISKPAQKYDIYVPLHQLWTAYIQEVLWDGKGFSPVNNTQAAKLCSADFNGAELEVVRSRCVSRVGVKGIVVKDLKSVFELITIKDKVKIVPKEGTVFRFHVPVPQERQSCETTGGISMTQKDTVESPLENAASTNLVFELHGDQFRYRATDRANRKFKPHFLPNL